MHKRISQLAGTEIYRLCQNLTRIYRTKSVENFGRSQLYSFLNKVMVQKNKSTKRSL